MSTVDKKTLAGLLLGIGAFALAAKKGSRSFFPEPTGKTPKGPDGAFTEEQDEIFFAFKQNAPTKSVSTKFGPDLDSRRQEKRQISQMQSQKSSRQQSLQQLQRSLAQDTFGDATAIAQMQNEVNSIQAQIDNAKNTMEGLEASLQDPMLSADLVDDYTNDFNKAQSDLEAAQQRLSNVARVLPQAQKTRMQSQASSVSAQISDLANEISTAKAQLATLQTNIKANSATGDSYTFEEYFNEHSERGYTPEAKSRYGTGSPGEIAWDSWEKQMSKYKGFGEVSPKFTGEEVDSSSIMGTGFKTGVTPLDPQGAFSGDVDNSDPFAPKSFSLPKFK
jgi:hypothetical protein